MERYKNLSGEGGVSFYHIGDDYIDLQFRDAKIYTYDYQRPGKIHVEKMKALAKKGKGLSTYINKHVRENYARVR